MRASHLAPVLVLISAVAAAQAPRITPAGDPSVKNDTIYSLAVDPAKHPEESIAILLDDGVVRVEADGRTTRTYRMVTQLLKSDVEENYQEQSFSYAPGHQRLTVNWIRVVRPNGEIVSAEPSHVQDSDIPASEGDPVYSDQKVRRVSLTGVKAGMIVDWSYTIEELKPFLPGDFLLSWSVNPGSPVLRSRYIVDAPGSLELRIKETNLNFTRQTRSAGDRRVYAWIVRDLPGVRPEPLAADSNDVYMSVSISSPITWSDIASWYAGHASTRYALTEPVARAADSIVASARTRRDSIRALHRWVTQDIRYVSIALGLGGYQPRAPEEVVRTGFGDCKDKATLFIAALARYGITAYPVLLSSSDAADRDLPSIEQFNHVIAAVQSDSGYIYTDLTADLVAYGRLPISYQGGFGVVVREKRGEEIRFPVLPIDANLRKTTIVGSVSDEGTFTGRYTEEAHGSHEPAFRDDFRHPLDSTVRANAANAVARAFFEGAVGDSLEGFDGLDLSAPPRMSLLIREGRAADVSGNAFILRMPLRNMRMLADAARELENSPPRRFPIDPAKFWGNGTATTEVRMKLPAGWKARLPRNVSASSAFGSYRAEYAQVGDEFVIRRLAAGATAVQPASKLPELIGWLRAVATDDVRMIMVDRAEALQAGRP